MQFLQYIIFSLILLLGNIFLNSNSLAQSRQALAILSNIKGEVNTGPNNKLNKGFNSKMLWKNYNVKTEKKSSTTIFFKDGSEIRLFGESNLKIGAKKNPLNRWIRYRLLLKYGSFWGYFSRGSNPVEISNKGIRVLVSNASIRFSKLENGLNISATSGIVKVINKVSSVKLNSGQRLYQIQKKDFLPKKISYIPNQLKILIEPNEPFFVEKKSLIVDLKIQVVRSGTYSKIKRPGPIFLRTNYYNAILPNSIILNKEGEVKTKIKINPPHFNDRTFGGTLIFQAIMDQYGYDDVQDGSFKSTFGFR